MQIKRSLLHLFKPNRDAVTVQARDFKIYLCFHANGVPAAFNVPSIYVYFWCGHRQPGGF